MTYDKELAAQCPTSSVAEVELVQLCTCVATLHEMAEELRGGTLYQAALASGLAALLSSFNRDVVQVESILNHDPMWTTYHLRYELREHIAHLPAVEAVVAGILAKHERGGTLLNSLYDAAQNGDNSLRSVFER